MAVQAKKQLFTVEDYYKMADLGIIPERGVELLNGEIYQQGSAVKKKFTVEEYYQLVEAGIIDPDAQVELINGEIIPMSPIKSNHAGHVNRLSKYFNKILDDLAIVAVQNPIHLNSYSEPQPDIAILKPVPDFYSSAHPTPRDIYWLMEVADTSIRLDRESKLPLYANANIGEVWIVNLKKRVIEVYRNPQHGKYQSQTIIADDASIRLSFFDLTIEVKALLG